MEQNAITLKEIFSLLRTEDGKGIELLYRSIPKEKILECMPETIKD